MTALAVGRPYSPPGIRMAHTIDLCVSDPVAIDMTVFDHWIEGLSIEEAATTVMAEEAEPLVADRQEWQTLLLADTGAQYRTFWMLKPLFEEPLRLASQRRFRIPPPLRQQVLDAFYSFDERLMREVSIGIFDYHFGSAVACWAPRMNSTPEPSGCGCEFGSNSVVFR